MPPDATKRSRLLPSSSKNTAPGPDDHNPLADAHNAAELRQHSSAYKNRICVPLSGDAFLEVTRAHLAEHGIHYARIPFRSRDEVYYMFHSFEDVAVLLQVVPRRPR